MTMLFEQAEQAIETFNTTSDAPEWAKGLMGIFQGLITEIKILSTKLDKVVELDSLLQIQKTTTDNLKKENDRLNERITSLEISVDNNEQHDRNINLLLHGVPETLNENTTNEFVKALNPYIRVYDNEIARSHRLGPPKVNKPLKPRPIIARFYDESVKLNIYRRKKALKGANLLITENLTLWRQSLFNSAKFSLGVRNVWTNEGRIFSKVNNKKFEIRSINDIPPRQMQDNHPQSHHFN